MAYERPRKPRIYTCTLAHLALRGTTPSTLISLAQGTLNSGSAIVNLIASNPLARTSFDTSANLTTHLIIAFDLQDTSQTISFLAQLNHNLLQAETKLAVYHHTAAINAATIGAATAVSATYTLGAKDEFGQTLNNGEHLLTWTPVAGKRYWAVEIQDASSFNASYDLQVGQVMLGNHWTADYGVDEQAWAPGMQIDGVRIEETPGGRRWATASWLTGCDGDVHPFGVPFRQANLSYAHQRHAGRRVRPFTLFMMPDTSLWGSDLSAGIGASATLRDVLSRSGGRALPVIFAPDSTSVTPGDYIYGRIARAGDPQLAAAGYYTQQLTIEEEF